MICLDCRVAAKVANGTYGVLTESGRPEEARMLHGQCRGGSWCDCQHQPVTP